MIEVASYDSHFTDEPEDCFSDLSSIVDDYECFIDDLCQLLDIENNELCQTMMSNKLKNDIYKRVESLKNNEQSLDLLSNISKYDYNIDNFKDYKWSLNNG